MELKGARALVTGGAGFIGSHLADRLAAEGCRVRVLDDLSNGRRENLSQLSGAAGFELIQGSVLEPSDVKKAMKGADVVFHLACLGVRHSLKRPFENHRVNAEGALNVLEAARTASVARFVGCSSSEVYGTAERVPMPEGHPVHPCTVYGASKLAGEAYVRAYHATYGLPAVVVRPFNTYGPRSHHEGDAGEMIPKSIVRALNGKPILVFGDGSQTRDFTYVSDIASALVLAARCDAAVGLTLNAGSGFEVSIARIAELIREEVGSSSKIRRAAPRPGDVLRLFADASRMRKLTGWRPEVSFEEGLKRTIESFRARPEGARSLLGQEAGRNWE